MGPLYESRVPGGGRSDNFRATKEMCVLVEDRVRPRFGPFEARDRWADR